MLLQNSELYCPVCNESEEYKKVCIDCRLDDNVAYLNKDYSDYEYGISYTNFYRNSHSLKKLEEIAINKHSGPKPHKKFLAKVQKMREDRIASKNKYILIRGELINLLNKFYDDDASYIKINDIEFRIKIKKCAVTDLDPFTSACQVYEIIKNELGNHILKAKIKILFDTKLNEIFGNNVYIIKADNYYTNFLKSDKTLDEAKSIIDDNNTIALLQNIVDKKLRKDEMHAYMRSNKISFRDEYNIHVDYYMTGQTDFSTCTTTLLQMEKRHNLSSDVYRIISAYKNKYPASFVVEFGKEMHQFGDMLPESISYVNGTYAKTSKTLQTNIVKQLAKEFVPKYKKLLIRLLLEKTKLGLCVNELVIHDEIIRNYVNTVDYKPIDYSRILPQNIIDHISNFFSDIVNKNIE